MLAAMGCNAFAQKNCTDDYNIRKAHEALKLLGKQLEITTHLVEALLLRLRIYLQKDELGKALAYHQGQQAEGY